MKTDFNQIKNRTYENAKSYTFWYVARRVDYELIDKIWDKIRPNIDRQINNRAWNQIWDQIVKDYSHEN